MPLLRYGVSRLTAILAPVLLIYLLLYTVFWVRATFILPPFPPPPPPGPYDSECLLYNLERYF